MTLPRLSFAALLCCLGGPLSGCIDQQPQPPGDAPDGGSVALDGGSEGVDAAPTPDADEPVEPDPVEPDPVEPDPVEPDPVEPDPVEPDPVEPDPVEPDPVEPDPVEPDPVEPDPEPTTEYAVAPLDIIALDAAPFVGATTPTQRYRWTVVDRPAGSVSAPVEVFDDPRRPADGGRPDDEATSTAAFFVDIAGHYVIELAVEDDGEPIALAFDRIMIDAVPPDDIHIQLVWDTPADADQTDNDGTDLDLWVLHPSADGWVGMNNRLRCYYGNPSPDWGAEDDPEDDPGLDIDDTNGAGPENINLNHPEDTAPLGGQYRVGVHYYRSWQETGGGEHGPSIATVRIYLDGELAHEAARQLGDTEDFWQVAGIIWNGADRRVAPIDVFSELPPE